MQHDEGQTKRGRWRWLNLLIQYPSQALYFITYLYKLAFYLY